MFISNNEHFVIFDPICDHFPGTNELEPGYKIDEIQKNMYGIFDDVLDGFNFDGAAKTSLNNATMFRFPIRSAYSNISNTTHDAESIKKMIDDYIKNNQETLLFLNNIKKISFFTVKSNSANGLIINCIHKEEIKYENKNDLAKRRQYFDNLLKNIEEETSFSNIETNINDYNIIIETSNEVTNSTKQNRYFMFEQFGFEYANKEEIDNMEYIKKQLNISKYFPMGGIAFNASLFETDSYKYQDFKIYNNLPLEQKSPLAVHINAYWALSRENRTQLYDYTETKTTVEKEKAVWNTEWNLLNVNNIILPCYLRLLKKLTQKYTQIDDKNKFNFLKNMKYLFPSDTQNMYFKPMIQNFYQKIIIEVECIPLVQNTFKNSTEYASIKWFKWFNSTEYAAIKWFKPGQIYFSFEFEAFLNDIKSEQNQVENICNILTKADLNICRTKKIFDLFKKASISLKELNGKYIIDGFKKSNEIHSDKDLKETIFENIDNLIIILMFCLKDKDFFNIIDGCPLLVSNDNQLRKFTKVKNGQLFYFEKPKIFKNIQHLFVNEHLIRILSKNEDYFKNIKIYDLIILLPTALNEEVYSKTEYPALRKDDIIILQTIWTIILNNCTISNLNKTEKINLLNPIKRWSLIPVQNEKGQTLSRIEYCQDIIVNPEQGNKFKFLNLIGVPVFDNRLFDEETNQFLLSTSINLNKNEDMLSTFNKQKDNIKNLKDEDLIQIRQFLNDSLEKKIKLIHHKKKTQNEFYFAFKQTDPNFFRQESDIKTMIKSLPIFTSILIKTDNILNKTTYVIQSALCIDGLDLFCEANNIFLIDSKCKFDNLYEYLEVQHLTYDEFYIKFLTWASYLNKVDFLKQHLINIINHFGIFQNEKIIKLVSQVRFVNTNGTYMCVNELYNHEKRLFKICFSHLFLPEEFSSEQTWPVWKDFMLKLGLKNKISMNDYLKTANTLKTYFHSKQIKMDKLMKYVDLMFEEIAGFKKENQMETLLEKLKFIEFIPNYYHYDAPPIKLNKEFKDLICLKDSYFKKHEQFVWLTHDILPNFCKEALSCSENYYKIAGIHYELDSNDLIKNFQKLINVLKEKDYLNNTNIDDIKASLNANFKEMQSLLKNSNLASNLNQLKDLDFIITRNRLNNKYQFVSITNCIKNLQSNDVIENYIYSLPFKLNEFTTLFDFFGMKHKVSFEMCSQILTKIYECTKNKELTVIQYRDVITIYKMLFSYDILTKNNINQESIANNKFKLYAPNKSKIMHELNSLFYIDISCYECIIEKNDYLKDICLFDIKDLTCLFENPSYYDNLLKNKSTSNSSQIVSNNDTHLLKKIMLKRLSWPQLFESFSFFNLAPKPISKILTLKIKEETSMIKSSINDEQLNQKLHSTKFANALVDIIQILDDSKKTTISTIIEELIKNVLSNITCLITKEIKTFLIDTTTNETINKSERDLNFLFNRNLEQMTFLRTKNCDDDLDKFFYLAEALLESIQIVLIKESESNLLEILKKKNHRFILLTIKLLQSLDENYKIIIEQYNLNSMFDF
jgi:hypothetical protein